MLRAPAPSLRLSTPPPGESFLHHPHPHPSASLLPQPPTLWEGLHVWEQLESPASPHPGPGLQDASRKVRQTNPKAPPTRVAYTAYMHALHLCPRRQAHTLIFRLGQGLPARTGDLRAGGALEPENCGKASSGRVCGQWWPQSNKNLMETLQSPCSQGVARGRSGEQGQAPTTP